MTDLREAAQPFSFSSRLSLLHLTGVKARTVRQLLEGIRKAPDAVIYHHTHHYLQQHQHLSPEPPNDFAYWVSEIIGDDALGERLASVDISRFPTLAALRNGLVQCLRTYLKEARGLRRFAPPGHEFQFVKAVTFVLPTVHIAHNLEEFYQILQEVSIQSLYFHVFEARLRWGRETNDFSRWLEESLGEGETELARTIAQFDPYTHTLEGLRRRILVAVRRRLRASDA